VSGVIISKIPSTSGHSVTGCCKPTLRWLYSIQRAASLRKLESHKLLRRVLVIHQTFAHRGTEILCEQIFCWK
jgi:hypothetical protein